VIRFRTSTRRWLVATLLGVLAATGTSLPGPISTTGPALATGGLTTRWTFDAGSGTTVEDVAGDADGVLSGGASWGTDAPFDGPAYLSFDGVDGRVDVANSASLEVPEIAISIWVRGDPAAPPVAGQTILEKGAFACGGPSYGLYVAADGIRFSYRSWGTGEQATGTLTAVAARTTLWDGAWHLIAAFVNAPAFGGARLSLDGSTRTTVASTAVNSGEASAFRYVGATDGDLTIGGPVDPACGSTPFHGDIDDVRIYADDSTDTNALMPAEPVAIDVGTIGTLHPGEYHTYSFDVSPAPRFGAIKVEIGPAGLANPFTTYAYPDWTTGHAELQQFVSNTPGPYELRASFVGYPFVADPVTVGFTVVGNPVSIVVGASPAPPLPNTSTTLTATLTSAAVDSAKKAPAGLVAFYETTTGTQVHLGTATLAALTTSSSRATLVRSGGFSVGTHTIVAKYADPEKYHAATNSSTFTLVVPKAASGVQLLTPGSVETHHSIVLEASIQTAVNGWNTNALVSFWKVGGTTAICTVPVNTDNVMTCSVPSQPVGSHQFVAKYSGNATVAASNSAPQAVNVVADQVHAHGFATQYATFYPVVDTYKDTTAISGIRDEPISVTIQIFASNGGLVKSTTIPLGSGKYSFAWNGRNAAGAVLGEGTYKVVQTLKDAYGTTFKLESSITLSKKKLLWKTVDLTKSGSTLSASGYYGTGSSVTISSTGYAKLTAGSGGWAGAGWQFTLPSATVYGTIAFRVYAKTGWSVPPKMMGVQDFTVCPYVAGTDWVESCFANWSTLGNSGSTTAWYSTTVDAKNRSGTIVRGMVSNPYGTTYVYKAQVRVTYATLGY